MEWKTLTEGLTLVPCLIGQILKEFIGPSILNEQREFKY